MALSPEQIALLEWTVSPVAERRFVTQQDLAAHLGVSEVTLSRWKRLPEIKEALTAASLEWAEEKGPKVINALVGYALLPGGTKDRETFAKYVHPAIIKARQDNFLDVLKPQTSGTNKISRVAAMAQLTDFSQENQELFYNLLVSLGKVQGEEPTGDEDRHIEVRKREEDIIDAVPMLPAGPGPGRPRGSRKVRLVRRDEQGQD